MCGIAGFWRPEGVGAQVAAATATRMACAIRHRGPDDSGVWVDAAAGVALAHRRLSVVDLSPQGRQPMLSASGRYAMVFNGEVYNHARLRPELERVGFAFRGHSDTEVMLAAIEHWGLEGALPRFIGMFAFALWDRHERAVTLVRDRLGIKPLYFGWVGGAFAFGSELRALRALPGFDNAINRDALSVFMRHNAVPAPHCIYTNIYKLLPGTCLRVDAALAGQSAGLALLRERMQPFWSARTVAEAGAADRLDLPDSAAADQLDRLLRDAVALRMEADVPLGAFLSGGIDSSTVVALMQAQSARPVKTFSIGFHEQGYDEARYAKAVAQHLGTEHHELYVTAQAALDVVLQLPALFDEPFADSSQIPTYLVSRLARGDVTVSLSGDGGDELFGGYGRYFKAMQIGRLLRKVPARLRPALGRMLRAHVRSATFVFGQANRMLPSGRRIRNPTNKIGILADMLAAGSDDERYRLLVSHWRDPDALVLGAAEPLTAVSDPAQRPALADPVERMMYTDLVTYLPDDILTKVDRASMAVSLEARTPLLDHRVAELAWRLPMHQKVRGGQGKWLLRQVLCRYVPKELIERPKMGFGVPIGQWLRGPLRDWTEALLDEHRLREEGYFNPAPIRSLWAAHVSGRVNEEYRLWGVLMFQAWLEAKDSCIADLSPDSSATAVVNSSISGAAVTSATVAS